MSAKSGIGGERNGVTRRIALVSSTAALLVPALFIGKAALRPRRLALGHAATEEFLHIEYHSGSRYIPEAMTAISKFLGDPIAKTWVPIDPGLIDLLYDLTRAVHRAGYPDSTLLVHEAYIHPERLARQSSHEPNAMAAMHTRGHAADISVAGFSGMELLNIAVPTVTGGIGYNGRRDQVHIDIGKRRRWSSAA